MNAGYVTSSSQIWNATVFPLGADWTLYQVDKCIDDTGFVAKWTKAQLRCPTSPNEFLCTTIMRLRQRPNPSEQRGAWGRIIALTSCLAQRFLSDPVPGPLSASIRGTTRLHRDGFDPGPQGQFLSRVNRVPAGIWTCAGRPLWFPQCMKPTDGHGWCTASAHASEYSPPDHEH